MIVKLFLNYGENRYFIIKYKTNSPVLISKKYHHWKMIMLRYKKFQKKSLRSCLQLTFNQIQIFFVIFSFCIPKHIICFKQTFFFMQQKKRYTYLKNFKNLGLKNQKKKILKIIVLWGKHFNLQYLLFYFRSIDQKIKELEAKNFCV